MSNIKIEAIEITIDDTITLIFLSLLVMGIKIILDDAKEIQNNAFERYTIFLLTPLLVNKKGPHVPIKISQLAYNAKNIIKRLIFLKELSLSNLAFFLIEKFI